MNRVTFALHSPADTEQRRTLDLGSSDPLTGRSSRPIRRARHCHARLARASAFTMVSGIRPRHLAGGRRARYPGIGRFAHVAIHRTFLIRDGSAKAPVEPAKMMLGPCGGGVVRLDGRPAATADGRRGHRDMPVGDAGDRLAGLGGLVYGRHAASLELPQTLSST